MSTNKPAIPVLSFRLGAFEELASERGCGNDAERARLIGVTQAHYYRVAKGETRPGERFVAAVLTALPDSQFSDLFEIEEVAR